MAQKIIFLGPRNAGKNSLRKIFFEGETPQYLLDNPLKPTQGIENTILDLGSKIGVFDLAGQQNKQWLDTEKDIVFNKADIIAGDFLFVKKHMIDDLSGKIIITNTTTSEDVEDLRKRGVEYLVTSTPVFEGRSFGTNVLEAVLVAVLKKPVDSITPEDYIKCLNKLGFKPRVEKLN